MESSEKYGVHWNTFDTYNVDSAYAFMKFRIHILNNIFPNFSNAVCSFTGLPHTFMRINKSKYVNLQITTVNFTIHLIKLRVKVNATK